MKGFCGYCMRPNAPNLKDVQIRKFFGHCHSHLRWYSSMPMCSECRKYLFGIWKYYHA